MTGLSLAFDYVLINVLHICHLRRNFPSAIQALLYFWGQDCRYGVGGCWVSATWSQYIWLESEWNLSIPKSMWSAMWRKKHTYILLELRWYTPFFTDLSWYADNILGKDLIPLPYVIFIKMILFQLPSAFLSHHVIVDCTQGYDHLSPAVVSQSSREFFFQIFPPLFFGWVGGWEGKGVCVWGGREIMKILLGVLGNCSNQAGGSRISCSVRETLLG